MLLPYICNEKVIFIKKNNNETTENFYIRCNFIIKQKPKNDVEIEKYNMYSNIYINHKFNNVVYINDISNKLKLMINKL
ncbi:hypothetical protein Hokovirus_2_77 [Hokovirus HKV1]|uniref:Uncharacterized protein n=1 Tax=Hokovirus HKV1 TaxID=1977638 RepID=A0A1V0SFQ5_9VIRU|nr:hypothetical protein Hokovirus_2_77 [Hokovirus HKV1]